jgi:hypothetical protein
VLPKIQDFETPRGEAQIASRHLKSRQLSPDRESKEGLGFELVLRQLELDTKASRVNYRKTPISFCKSGLYCVRTKECEKGGQTSNFGPSAGDKACSPCHFWNAIP